MYIHVNGLLRDLTVESLVLRKAKDISFIQSSVQILQYSIHLN